MEATCQHPIASWPNEHGEAQVCGAPIPRLVDEGPCVVCGLEFSVEHLIDPHPSMGGHPKIGPLASECANGHPVAVQSEAEKGK